MYSSARQQHVVWFGISSGDLRGFVQQLEGMAITAIKDFDDDIEAEYGPRPEGGYQMVPPQGYVETLHTLPRLTWNSVLVLIWSHFERVMVDACRADAAQEAAIQNEEPKATGRTMKGVQTYWSQRGVAYPSEWLELDQIRKLRNLIVHENGLRTSDFALSTMDEPAKAEVKKELGGFFDDLETVEKYFDRRLSAGRTGAVFLGLEIVLSSAFCIEVIDLCQAFFDKLIAVVPDTDESLWRPPGGFRTTAS